MIKSNNAPSQYKNKWAFGSIQQLADKYNVTIIRVYGIAGHGKVLIDARLEYLTPKELLLMTGGLKIV